MIQHRICMTGVALLLSLSYAWTEAAQASKGPPKAAITWYAKDHIRQNHEEQTLRHAGYVNSVAFSPDGKQVLTGSSDNTAVLQNTATGQTLQTWKHAGGVLSVAFSPDGKQVLTGSWDQTAVLWDAVTGQTLHTWKCPTSACVRQIGVLD